MASRLVEEDDLQNQFIINNNVSGSSEIKSCKDVSETPAVGNSTEQTNNELNISVQNNHIAKVCGDEDELGRRSLRPFSWQTRRHGAICQERPQRSSRRGLQELVGGSTETRNWRGILIALLVILIVCALIVVAVILVTPRTKRESPGEKYSFEDIFDPELVPKHFHATWVKGEEKFVFRNREGEVIEYDITMNTTSKIMDNTTFRHYNTDTYFVSPDLQYVLIAYEIEHVYRHSFLAKYIIYDRYSDSQSKTITFPSGDRFKDVKLQYAGWSEKGRSLTFVYKNNLYYQASPSVTWKQLSQDGVEGHVYTGIPDWVYEEELLSSNKAHWWSPESTFICYATFDDRDVPSVSFPYYGPGDNVYSDITQIPYPKAGNVSVRSTPRVELFIVKTSNLDANRITLSPPEQFHEYYVSGVYWVNDKHVMVVWLNRPQNVSIVSICEAVTGDCHMSLREFAGEGMGWVNIPPPLILRDPSPDRSAAPYRYMMVLPQRDGSDGYWKHIALVTQAIQDTKQFLTNGKWEVGSLASYDPDEGQVYFYAALNDPKERHIYRMPLDNSLPLECITCREEEEEGCKYVDASFSSSGRYYIQSCLGPDVPSYSLRSIRDDTYIMLEDNEALKQKLSKKAMPRKEYVEVQTSSGQTLWAELVLPPVLNTEHLLKYALLLHVYGGPATQKVDYKFRLGWGAYLASSHKIIYAAVDGRGSLGRGETFLHSVYGKLGTLEVEDQLLAVHHMSKNLQYVDGNRTAIWGWSYGGFVTGHAVGNETNIFNCGIAVAPVTDWRYYDTVYTERYMGLANENYRGYDRANLSAKADYFRNKKFLLIHGTADDNVHFQHSAQLIKALTEADVDFRMQLYTDKNHALSGAHTKRHLHRTMTNFLLQECWDGASPVALGDKVSAVDKD